MRLGEGRLDKICDRCGGVGVMRNPLPVPCGRCDGTGVSSISINEYSKRGPKIGHRKLRLVK